MKCPGAGWTPLPVPAPVSLEHHVGFKLGKFKTDGLISGQSLPQNLCMCLGSKELRQREGRDCFHTAPCPPALLVLSLHPPHARAGEDSSARSIQAALHKECHWSFQMNIYQTLLSFQWFWPALPWCNGQLGSSRHEEDMPRLQQLLGTKQSCPACVLPVPWGMAQNVAPAAPGILSTSLNGFVFFSIYF